MEDCLFCKIVKKNIPAAIEYEDDEIVAFKDINPKARIHLLIIPKKHIGSLNELKKEDTLLCGKLIQTAKAISHTLGITGYKIQINTGKEVGQEIFHIHLHFLAH